MVIATTAAALSVLAECDPAMQLSNARRLWRERLKA
jgi:hypothetical protein